MKVLDFNTDIGACWSRNNNYQFEQIICLGRDGNNYCCKASNYSNIMHDSGKRACCTYEQYADQHWVTMAVIQGFSILLAFMFAMMLCISAWFYLSSCGINEAEVKEHRRKVITHLLRNQILNRSHHNEPSILSSLKKASRSFSSSSGRHRELGRRTPADEKVLKRTVAKSSPKHVRFISH